MTPRPSRKLLLLEQWSRGIARIAAAQRSGAFIPELLASVKRLVDFDFVMVFAYSGTARPLTLGDTLDAPRRRIIADDYAGGPFLLDPFFRLVEEGQRSGCFRLHDVAPDHFRRSEYFRVHYSRTGIGEEIGIFFDLGRSLTGVTSFGRWDVSPPVTASDLDMLRALEPAIGALCAGHWSNLHGSREAPQFQMRGMSHPDFRALTLREREIVTLILRGHSTESIAMQLGISPGTVKIHRKNIYRKMRVSAQAELFAAFIGYAAAPSAPAYSPGDMEDRHEIPQLRGSSQ